MKKRILILVLLMVCQSLIGAQVEGIKLIVVKLDDQSVSGDLLEVRQDSLVLMPGALANVIVPVDEIKYIAYEENKSKLVEKMITGMVIGALIPSLSYGGFYPRSMFMGAMQYGIPIGIALSLGTKRSKLKKVWFYGKTLDEKRNRLFSLRRYALVKN